MGYQTSIAATIRDGQGHDVLALKANQPTVYANVQALFADARTSTPSAYGLTSATETTSSHGWIATHTADVISDPAV